jgi:hypothetical protein
MDVTIDFQNTAKGRWPQPKLYACLQTWLIRQYIGMEDKGFSIFESESEEASLFGPFR